MTQSRAQVQRLAERKIAAGLIVEARGKEFEAACWIGLQSNIEEARANLHSALDASLDATLDQVKQVRDQIGNAST